MRWLCIALLAGCSASDDIPSPLISGIVPDHGPPGAVVMLSGSSFCQRGDNGQDDPTCDAPGVVEFGTVPGITTSWADDAIMVEVPQTTGQVDVSVSAGGRISNIVSFAID